MNLKTETSVSLIATDRVSLFNWKGFTRVQFNETSDSTLEVANVDSEELLLAVSYFVRDLAKDAERSDRQTRLLHDIMHSLQESLKVKKETENATA